jgi:phytanoyl-CoA dioxygenase PhyH
MSERDDLERDGYVVVRRFYDSMEVEAVQGQIALIAGRTCLPLTDIPPRIYEGAKQAPALYRLISSPKSFELIHDLRPHFMAGIAEGGIQVRADMPNDERWRTHWHQDGTFQGRASDGLTFWTPLLHVTEDMGPVEICGGSHRAGLLPITNVGDKDGLGRARSYTWEIEGVDDVVAGYEIAVPLTNPGDVIVMDYATVHRSGRNVSAVPRWAALWRYFNFACPDGQGMGWKRPAQFGPQAA